MLKFVFVLALATYSSVYGAGGGSHGSNSASLQGESENVYGLSYGGEHFVHLGEPFEITCNLTQFGRIKWAHNDRPIKMNLKGYTVSEIVTKGFIISRLSVSKSLKEHTGEYSCTTFSSRVHKLYVLNDDESVSFDCQAKEGDAMEGSSKDTKCRFGRIIKWSEQDTETTKQMRVGAPLPLQCKIAADEDNKDEKIELKWFKEGEELTADALKEDGMTVFHENATLLINKAEEKHGGHYRCEASEFKPPRTFDVTVVYLHCKAMPKSMTFLQGDKMALTCDVAGNPTPTVIWHKDDVIVDEAMNISRYSLEKNGRGVPNGTLIVLDAVDDDRATYKCLVASADITYETKTLVRIKGMYAALWPFLGICAEVLVLCVIIFVYEKRRAKNDFEESDTDQPNDQPDQ